MTSRAIATSRALVTRHSTTDDGRRGDGRGDVTPVVVVRVRVRRSSFDVERHFAFVVDRSARARVTSSARATSRVDSRTASNGATTTNVATTMTHEVESRARSVDREDVRSRRRSTSTSNALSRASENAEANVRASDVHVLVVDDERICRTVTSLLLRNCGYRVTAAASGEEALELLRRGTEFHLLLTDVMMPGIDGPALLQIVRNDERLRDLPVIMMSANEHSETVFRCIQYGAEDYLLKPVSKKAVKHMWQHVWRKSQLLAARAVPRFENGEEVLEDDEDRGEMVHGVPAVPEHPSSSNLDDHSGALTEHTCAPGITRVEALIGDDDGVNKCPFAARRAGDIVKEVALTPTAQDTAMEICTDDIKTPMAVDADVQLCSVPERALRPLPAPLPGFPNGPRNLKDWMLDQAAMKVLSREDRIHVAAQIAFFFSTTTRKIVSVVTANDLNVSPQGSISWDNLGAGESNGPCVGDHSLSTLVFWIELQFLFPQVYAGCIKDRGDATARIKSMTGFASEMKSKSRRAESDIIISLIASDCAMSAATAFDQFQALAGVERAHAVETERRIEALRRLETILETLRTARYAQKQEFAHSRNVLEALVAESGADIPTSNPDSPARKRAKREGDVSIAEKTNDGVECYDDEALKLVDLSAVLNSGYRSAKSLETSVFVELERSLFVKCARAMAAEGANEPANSDTNRDEAWVKRLNVDGASVKDALKNFADELCLVTRSLSLKRCASIGGDFADFAANNAMVCCVSWDRDGELFATAGTSKSICVYETSAVVRLGARVHCPALEFKAQSKVSALCCNPYVKQSLASGDYQGTLQLWDVAKEVSIWENTTHRRRVWSIDFSDVDPTRLASGSDDGSVRVFSTTTKESVCVLNNRANVCSVKFHPTAAHLIAIGSADHKVHCYDLRQPNAPFVTLQGHRKAVSYVRWVGDEVVSASTDNTLKLWDLNQRDPRHACVRTYIGHTNEKNFVGLSANAHGYIACGSEDNVVHVYAKHASSPVASYDFNSQGPSPVAQNRRDKGGFISSVAWSPDNKHLIAANSRGHLKILELCKM